MVELKTERLNNLENDEKISLLTKAYGSKMFYSIPLILWKIIYILDIYWNNMSLAGKISILESRGVNMFDLFLCIVFVTTKKKDSLVRPMALGMHFLILKW